MGMLSIMGDVPAGAGQNVADLSPTFLATLRVYAQALSAIIHMGLPYHGLLILCINSSKYMRMVFWKPSTNLLRSLL